MKNDKKYQDSSLTLQMVAKELKIPPHHLSKLISEEFGCNYTQYIGKYRIDNFKERIRNGDSDKFDLLGIAQSAGFASKASFYRIFKESEGITPKQFVNSINNERTT